MCNQLNTPTAIIPTFVIIKTKIDKDLLDKKAPAAGIALSA